MLCALCGTETGNVGRDVRLISVNRLSASVELYSKGCIRVCNGCYRLMPMDPTTLCNMYESDAHDALVIKFIRGLITEVWTKDRAPSYQEIASCLNAVGLQTQQGRIWSYHNMRQKLMSLGFDKDAEWRQLWKPGDMEVDATVFLEAAKIAASNAAIEETTVTGGQRPFGDDGGIVLG